MIIVLCVSSSALGLSIVVVFLFGRCKRFVVIRTVVYGDVGILAFCGICFEIWPLHTMSSGPVIEFWFTISVLVIFISFLFMICSIKNSLFVCLFCLVKLF